MYKTLAQIFETDSLFSKDSLFGLSKLILTENTKGTLNEYRVFKIVYGYWKTNDQKHRLLGVAGVKAPITRNQITNKILRLNWKKNVFTYVLLKKK